MNVDTIIPLVVELLRLYQEAMAEGRNEIRVEDIGTASRQAIDEMKAWLDQQEK